MSTVEEKSKVWDSWPVELPSAAEKLTYPDYLALSDLNFITDMAAEIRVNAFKAIKQALGGNTSNTAVVLKGGMSETFRLYDSDTDMTEFRQEAFFRHLFQLNEPDCWAVLDLAKEEALVFVPEVTPDMERWNGPCRSLQYYIDTYKVQGAYLAQDLVPELKRRNITNLLTLYGVNSDSDVSTRTVVDFEGLDQFKVDNQSLYPVLCELRVHKTQREVEHLRRACRMSAQAHVYVMRHIKPGMTELQCEALFKAYAGYFGSSRHVAYTCICGSGPNGSILHYGHAGYPNARLLLDGDMIVLDMGAEFAGYTTDLTRSYPVNGVFTEDQRRVHAAVHEAQLEVYKCLKPGTSWVEMHQLAEKVIIQHLLAMGVLHNGTVEEMIAAHMGSVFMPHGLGHLLGMNVHDVGGFPAGCCRESAPGVKWLRTTRKLEAGMVLTVEPGCYFNEPWIRRAMADPVQGKYLNAQVLDRFWSFGGVRLEDDVLITEDGYELLTGDWPTTAGEVSTVVCKAQNKL